MPSVVWGVKNRLVKKIPSDIGNFRKDLKVEQMPITTELHGNIDELKFNAVDASTVKFLSGSIVSESFVACINLFIKGFKEAQESKYASEAEDLLKRDKEILIKLALDIKDKKPVELNDETIEIFGTLAKYETFFRSGVLSMEKELDLETKQNIKIMIERSIAFLRSFKTPIFFAECLKIKTSAISYAEGSYLTKGYLMSRRISKSPPDKTDGLTLIVYLMLGLKEGDERFKEIENLIVFNPRAATVGTLNVKDIPKKLLSLIYKSGGTIKLK